MPEILCEKSFISKPGQSRGGFHLKSNHQEHKYQGDTREGGGVSEKKQIWKLPIWTQKQKT